MSKLDTVFLDMNNKTELHSATEKGDLEAVKLLLEHKADVNVKGGGCLLEPVLNRSDTISQAGLG